MKRFRALAAVLACLAVMASGFMTVAAAAAPSSSPAPERSAMGEPCSHCDDCDCTPCPMAAAICVHVTSNPAPTLSTAAIEMPAIGYSKILWPLASITLSGLSRPPDPFPPRL